MTLSRMLQVYHLKDTDDIVKEETIKLPAAIISIEDICTNIEDLDNYLMRNLGETWIPLAFVVREEVALPAIDFK
jgi:hypothetical protein